MASERIAFVSLLPSSAHIHQGLACASLKKHTSPGEFDGTAACTCLAVLLGFLQTGTAMAVQSGRQHQGRRESVSSSSSHPPNRGPPAPPSCHLIRPSVYSALLIHLHPASSEKRICIPLAFVNRVAAAAEQQQ